MDLLAYTGYRGINQKETLSGELLFDTFATRSLQSGSLCIMAPTTRNDGSCFLYLPVICESATLSGVVAPDNKMHLMLASCDNCDAVCGFARRVQKQ